VPDSPARHLQMDKGKGKMRTLGKKSGL